MKFTEAKRIVEHIENGCPVDFDDKQQAFMAIQRYVDKHGRNSSYYRMMRVIWDSCGLNKPDCDSDDDKPEAVETINGYPIIAQFPTPKAPCTRAGRVILVDRLGDDPHGEHPRYVTAWQGRDGAEWDSSWCQGHYISDREEAESDFVKRCKRKG